MICHKLSVPSNCQHPVALCLQLQPCTISAACKHERSSAVTKYVALHNPSPFHPLFRTPFKTSEFVTDLSCALLGAPRDRDHQILIVPKEHGEILLPTNSRGHICFRFFYNAAMCKGSVCPGAMAVSDFDTIVPIMLPFLLIPGCLASKGHHFLCCYPCACDLWGMTLVAFFRWNTPSKQCMHLGPLVYISTVFSKYLHACLSEF